MKTINGINLLKNPLTQSVVTIGNFDGVHLGHREIISQVIKRANKLNIPSVVMTFDPHPRTVLNPKNPVLRLFGLDDQQTELEKMGLDLLIVEPFTKTLAAVSAETFFNNWLMKPLAPVALIVGHNFNFGANRAGTLSLLGDLTARFKVDLQIVPPFQMNGLDISSSRIREYLKNGEIVKANELLARPYYLKGLVVRGEGRGRKIGFPTANIATGFTVGLRPGVYETSVRLQERVMKAVTNVGYVPTFIAEGKTPIRVEVHILDFDEDIYGEELRVEFGRFLRDEKKFTSIEQLVEQIKKDIKNIRDA